MRRQPGARHPRQARVPRRRRRRISSILPLQWSTTSHPAANAARARSPSEPLSAPMERSSLINRPWYPIEPRITSRTIAAEVVAGAIGSMAVNTTCAVMASGNPASGRKAAKSLVSSVALSALTTGSFWWLSAVARPCPGMCLTTGRTPPSGQSMCKGTGKGCDLVWLGAEGAVADHSVGSRHRHDRRPACNRHRCRRRQDRPRSSRAPSRAAASPAARLRVIKPAIGGSRRIFRPMRRIEALHTAALLVDQHGRSPAERSAEVVDQPPQRLGLGDIALKHDQTPGLRSRRNARSASVSAGPAIPVMNARMSAA